MTRAVALRGEPGAIEYRQGSQYGDDKGDLQVSVRSKTYLLRPFLLPKIRLREPAGLEVLKQAISPILVSSQYIH